MGSSINVRMDRILINESYNKFGVGGFDREIRANLSDLSGRPIAELKIPGFNAIQSRYLSNSNNVLDIPLQHSSKDLRYLPEKTGIIFESLALTRRRIVTHWRFGRDGNTIMGQFMLVKAKINK
jgi:hypothetical protein